MATCKWLGNAAAVAQVTTATPGSVSATDTFTITINNKAITVEAPSTSVPVVVGLLVAAFNASTEPEFAEITATDGGTVVILTADVKGRPFTAIGSSSGGTLNMSTTTAASGPNHWDNTANWSGGAVPTSADDVVFENSAVDCLFGYPGSPTALTSLSILASYTGKIGLPDRNTGGYSEYRTKALALNPTTVRIGYGEGNGSPFMRLTTTGVAAGISVNKTGQPTDLSFGALYLVANTSSTTLEVLSGYVSVATLAGDAAQFSSVKIGYLNNPASDSHVRFGTGVTFSGAIDMSGGEVETNSALGTVNVTDGTLTHFLGAVTTLNLYGGTCFYNATGTLTTATVGSKGRLDFTRDMSAKTVTNTITLAAGAKLFDSFGVVSSLAYQAVKCSDKDVTVEVGFNKTHTIS